MDEDKPLDETILRASMARDLPLWSGGTRAITRTYRTQGWKGTLMAVNAIGHLAEVAWHHPDLQVSFASVTVHLTTHDSGGVTRKDLALARKIEEILMWRPSMEGSGLEGTPSDPKYAYMKYD